MFKVSMMKNSTDVDYVISFPNIKGLKNALIDPDRSRKQLKINAEKKYISLAKFNNNIKSNYNLNEVSGVFLEIENGAYYKIHIPELLTFLEVNRVNHFYIDSLDSKIKDQKGQLFFLFKDNLKFDDENMKSISKSFFTELIKNVFEDFNNLDTLLDKFNIDPKKFNFLNVSDLNSAETFNSLFDKGNYIDAEFIVRQIEEKNDDLDDNVKEIGKKQIYWQNVSTDSIEKHLEKSTKYSIGLGSEFNELLQQARIWNSCLKRPLPDKHLKITVLEIWNKEKNTTFNFKELITKYCENIYDVFFDIKNREYAIIFTEESDFIKTFKKTDYKQFLYSELVRNGCKVSEKRVSTMLMKQIESKESIYNPKKDFGTFIDKGRQFFNTCVLPEHAKFRGNSKQYTNKCEFILSIIRNLVSEKYLDDFINWLASWYQTKTKSRVSWVIKGIQGSGKGLLCEVIIPLLFGDGNCIQIGDYELESDFNNWNENKMFVNMDEVTRDYSSRNKVKNKIKKYITAEKTYINKKNVSPYSVTNYANYIITSNESLPIDIEIGDRRFIVVETYTKLKNEEWFYQELDGKRIKDPITKIRKEIKDFGHYLANYEIDEYRYNLVFDTPAKKKVLEGTLKKFEIFIEKLFQKEIEYFIDELEIVDVTLENNRATTYIKRLRKAFKRGFISTAEITEVYNYLFYNKNQTNAFITRKVKESRYGETYCQKRKNKVNLRGFKLK